MIDMDKAVSTAVKTGKVLFGSGNAIKSAKSGRCKLIVVASNCPSNVMHDLVYYAKLSDVPLVIYKGSSIDLGVTCGKPFMVSTLTIREPGDSDILKLVEKEEPEMEATEEADA